MKLLDLFEQDQPQPLLSGEKRIHPNLAIRNIQAIQTKISEFREALYKSQALKDTFKQDVTLLAALDKLEKRLRLKISYLNKMTSRPSSSQTKMVNILNKECSQFLEIVQHNKAFLYRGLRNTESVFEGRSRADRSPKDSSNDISERFDQALKNAGFTALRSNSIFTTSDYTFANSYGRHVYVIFPKNGFSFLTTNQRDLILDYWDKLVDEPTIYEFAKNLNNWGLANVEGWQYTKLGELIQYEYHSELLTDLWGEFTWKGNPMNIPQEFNKTMADFVTDSAIMTKLQPNQTDMTESMREGREILIHGEYWALKSDDWLYYLENIYLNPQDSSSN